MVFDVKSVSVALLLTVYGVSTYPPPSGTKTGENKELRARSTNGHKQLRSDALIGNIELLKDGVEGKIELPSDQEELTDKEHNDVKQAERGAAIAGNVELNNNEITGNVEIPSDVEQTNNKQVNGSVIKGNVKLNAYDYVEGILEFFNYGSEENNQRKNNTNQEYTTTTSFKHIISSSDIDKQTQDKGKYDNNNKNAAGSGDMSDTYIQGDVVPPGDYADNANADNIPGTVESNGGAIEGQIEISSDNNQMESVSIESIASVSANSDIAIEGSIEMDRENIQGHIDFNDIDNPRPQQVGSGGNNPNDKAITGNIEINGDYIEGQIEIPTDDDQQNAGVQNGDNNQNNEKAIAGNIEVNGEYVEGHIDIPTDDDKQNAGVQNGDNNQIDNKAITGNIEINGDYIEGQIEIPTDDDQQNAGVQNGDNNQDNDKAITGNIEINGDYIEGQIDIPTDDDNQNAGVPNGDNNQNNDKAITGNVDINDENIEGQIEIPSDFDQHKVGQDSNAIDINGDIAGSMEIDDDYVKGHIVIGDTEGQSDDDKNEPGNDDLPNDDDNESVNDKSLPKKLPSNKESCWMTLKAKHHFDALDELDEKYRTAREDYQNKIGTEFDQKMLDVMLTSQAAAPRAIHQAKGDPNLIPAGLNLGGYCLVRMEGSILFFHRMKLRNSTRFTVKYLHNDLIDMTLTTRILLNDIHLHGAYERATTDRNPSSLFFFPNIGEVELLLKNVIFKMEGRLRMLNDRLVIELVNSELVIRQILMTYTNANSTTPPITLRSGNIAEFLERMKCDLDLWLKDYFNDYLMYFGIVGGGNTDVQTYEKKKTVKVNAYADDIVNSIKKRIKNFGAASAKLPNFDILSVPNVNVKLTSGVLRGLNSIYRRSVGTTKKENKIRKMDMIVGFSNLKAEYKYEASVSVGTPPLSGKLILTADDLIAHMEVSHIAEPETIDFNIDSIVQAKPESLTVEGPANRWIGSFKQLLEHPIIALMTSTLRHNIKMMNTLTRCVPYIVGNEKRKPNQGVGNEKRKPNQGPDNKDDNDENNIDQDPAGDLSDDGNLEDPGSQDPENKKDWSDYVFSKNDSVEIEVPINGEKQKLKLERGEKFVISKLKP